jgi:hypothetical protein
MEAVFVEKGEPSGGLFFDTQVLKRDSSSAYLRNLAIASKLQSV